MKKILIAGILLICATQAHAGIISKFRNWANTGWENCPCYTNGYHNGINSGYRPPRTNRFFNNGAITGFTPPINGTIYPSFGNYHSPIHGRFDHFPNGMNTLNAPPQQMITDFNSNVGTRTGITILD